MVATVRGGAPGTGEGGQARTRLARRAVIEAARSLFLERGYAATTIDAISEQSDVPAPTVYRLFSSKLGILKALLDVSIAGDDRALSLPERPNIAALVGEADPTKLLAGFAAIAVAINTRSSDLYRILSIASGSDPAAAELLRDYQHKRAEGQGQFARSLFRSGSLRQGLRERDAADLIHALASPELYRLLVVDRNWSAERYENWLVGVLTEQLLSPRPDRTRPPRVRKDGTRRPAV